MSRLENTARTARRIPASFYDLEFVRSYAREDEDGNLWRVEVRQDPATGYKVQVSTPVTVDKRTRSR